MNTTTATPSPFWRFSLRFYASEGVPLACLNLQDRSGVDVNILLFALFAAGSGRRISGATAKAFIEALAVWKDTVVLPLRTARRALKEPPAVIDRVGAEALRSRVKAIELEAERLQQEALFARFPVGSLGAPDAPKTAARANIGACAEAFKASFDTDAVAVLLTAFDKLEDCGT